MQYWQVYAFFPLSVVIFLISFVSLCRIMSYISWNVLVAATVTTAAASSSSSLPLSHTRHHRQTFVQIFNICLKFKTNIQMKKKSVCNVFSIILIVHIIFNGLKSLFGALFLLPLLCRFCCCCCCWCCDDIPLPLSYTGLPLMCSEISSSKCYFFPFPLVQSFLSSSPLPFPPLLNTFIFVICCWCLMFALSFHKYIHVWVYLSLSFSVSFPSHF